MNRRIVNTIRVLLGFLILVLLFWKVGLYSILTIIREADIIYVILAILFSWTVLLFGGLGVHLLINRVKKVNFSKVLRYYLLSWSTGQVSPGKFGEFSLVYFLKQENISIGKGAVVSFFDKLISLTVVFTIACFGFFLFFDKSFAIRATTIAILLLVFVNGILFSSRGRNFIKKFILRKYSIHFKGFSSTLNMFIRKNKLYLFYNFLITLIRWGMSVLIVLFLFKAFNTEVPYFTILLISTMIAIIGTIPITAAGLGIRESVAVFLYEMVGIEASIVLSVYLVLLAMNYATAFLCSIFVKI